MNLLIDLVPNEIFIEGEGYEINSDFRTSILYELLMQDSSIGDDERLWKSLKLYYPVIPTNIKEAVTGFLWFYRGGKEAVEVKAAKGGGAAENIYSYDFDDEYIYAAFLDQYGVDLQDIEYLHWWKFKAMFKGLKEDTLISKIMGYRSININEDLTDSEKKYYRQMKELYRLPDGRSESEKENDFHNIMSNLV